MSREQGKDRTLPISRQRPKTFGADEVPIKGVDGGEIMSRTLMIGKIKIDANVRSRVPALMEQETPE